MSRVVIIGNAAGGKSTLARRMAAARKLPLIEVDRLLWLEGWKLAPPERYAAQHAAAIGCDRWIIEGLGRQDSISARMSRATEIILIDLPLWIHFALAAERQVDWHQNTSPAGLGTRPATMALFRTMWEVDQTWLPGIRDLCRQAGPTTRVVRLRSLEEIDAYSVEATRPSSRTSE